MFVSSLLKDEPCGFDNSLTYSDYLPEIQKRKDLAYTLFTDLNLQLEHNCHHHDCPMHCTNICRRWPAIPSDYKNCSFTGWFQNITGKTANLITNSLDNHTAYKSDKEEL
jgi:hypothetical protein